MLIGEFARLGQVSVRMLRHYDEIGLLKPDSVDEWSSYRSYSPEQLSTLNRIVALKDLGLGLDQVGRIMTDRIGVRSCTACCGCVARSWRMRCALPAPGWRRSSRGSG
jgi:DNA-binding transcriptional MerR regulator